MQEIILHDGTLIELGKTYYFSGTNEGYCRSWSWKDVEVKIREVTEDSITIYDTEDNKVITYTKDGIRKSGFIFSHKKRT
jgi:hypothetical protein